MKLKRILFLILFLFIYFCIVLSSKSLENVKSDQFEIGREFNVLLPIFDESFIMVELECFQVDEKSSFKIEKIGDEMYVGINYFDGNCSNIEGEFQFKCTNNFMDIISCEFFKVACSNKIVIPFEKEKKKETILMELYGYKGDFENSQELLQVLNDFSKLPRTFSSPHKVAYADDFDSNDQLQAIQINTKQTENEIIPVIEKEKDDDLKTADKNNTKISNENNNNNNNINNEKNNSNNYLNLNNYLISSIIILINCLIFCLN
ncbi:hypothetical protein DDB_G0288515 [Dictyostelium discoideum AX4]|uniref:Transmembrane protein n=1 Tax=Dictyostelium discoideum TaxID=44689 RepID=Q54IU4_DICDI|nr:hypothetical protein DDB_G0288515 [Dictyostelium discoideum AX4]EAL63179.1 hypothetical protein DDB_G0288515 [Dictyostelium discoideum AX4]|eukprot:XP_636682.1 hypothetical protein DDB_G0288515 [Dictyostelium discoideum AX4]